MAAESLLVLATPSDFNSIGSLLAMPASASMHNKLFLFKIKKPFCAPIFSIKIFSKLFNKLLNTISPEMACEERNTASRSIIPLSVSRFCEASAPSFVLKN